ncbi:MAG: universal stress protein [Myxococcales bacterium]|nr:universal stress protein [Myxococcales bacterium]MCB9708632.1 universal stress protein [Myxococcales bacterium]
MTSESPPKATYDIVLGVDFTPSCDLAFQEAARLFQNRDDVLLHVVHVIEEGRESTLTGRQKKIERDARALETVPSELRDYVKEQARRLRAPRWEAEIGLYVRLGKPAKAIVQLAADLQADMIVIGSHGRKGIAKALLGSVSESLIRIAPCQVLVVREQDYQGIERSPSIDPPRPGDRPATGEFLHNPQYSSRELVTFGGRTSHISGLL